jgi:hypothetical protein
MAFKFSSTGRESIWADGDANLLYLAFGTGLSSLDYAAVTELTTEVVRVAVTQYRAGDTVELTAYLSPAQGNGALTEVGLFTASSGGTALGYGNMQGASDAIYNSSTSRWEITKTNTKNLTYDLIVQLDNG